MVYRLIEIRQTTWWSTNNPFHFIALLWLCSMLNAHDNDIRYELDHFFFTFPYTHLNSGKSIVRTQNIFETYFQNPFSILQFEYEDILIQTLYVSGFLVHPLRHFKSNDSIYRNFAARELFVSMSIDLNFPLWIIQTWSGLKLGGLC